MDKSIYGYIRVSSKDQNEVRQITALKEHNVEATNIYIDKQSGKDFERPAYRRLLQKLQHGDLLIMKSIDRLGRNYQEIMEQWRIISKEKGADIRVLDMPLLDTTNNRDLLGQFVSDIVLQILSFVAESERENIRQRQAEGIALAKARGVKFGRSAKGIPNDFSRICEDWRTGDITALEASKRCGVHLSTFYKWVKAYTSS